MNKNNGFIALISVIVITMILLGVTATLGMKGFLDRFNILEGEKKKLAQDLRPHVLRRHALKLPMKEVLILEAIRFVSSGRVLEKMMTRNV